MDIGGQLAKNVVVWFDWDEWTEIYNALYSNDQTAQTAAIKRIAAWKSRGKLPMAVEATSSLVELLASTPTTNTTTTSVSENMRALALGMAINRLVNGVIESHQHRAPQNRTMNNRSMFAIAAQMNLPMHFVDIRHEAAHSSLPSIRVLCTIARTALTWLDDHYWQSQLTLFNGQRTNLKRILDTYSKQFDHTVNELGMGSGTNKNSTAKNTKIKDWLADNVRTTVATIKDLISAGQLEGILVPMLVDDGFLVPSAQSYTPLQKGDYTVPFLIDKKWRTLLKELHETYPHFFIILFYLLVDRITGANKIALTSKRLLAGWLMLLTRKYNFTSQTKETLNMELPYRFIFERCLVSSSQIATAVLETVAPMLTKKDQQSLRSKGGSAAVDPATQYNMASEHGKWRPIEWWTPCPIGVAPIVSTTSGSNKLDLPVTLDSGTASLVEQDTNSLKSINECPEIKQQWIDKVRNIINKSQTSSSTTDTQVGSKREIGDGDQSIKQKKQKVVHAPPVNQQQSIIDVDAHPGSSSTTTTKRNKKEKSVVGKVANLAFWK
ncbi:hypothetical protein SAMD00019534_109190 [Acytostelium subglobosum LB1]|uniref:hypothetical protein n=1 Tax=Acytostelium subglobosum LB1 TaxID=1410327 RepID=UPI0006448D33|nr:hypothetical protein SAMD00019534_109190 [Acytostelium subglobosum LB1]GAM27743.1 hypothetical protein SAMD00019534_109190 [Acytostelium subglobosum LB1]|eukprot:XP_012749402.1 hypothetical protein SAMD00019534_109190 [Acytostelium subglobosum LB1]